MYSQTIGSQVLVKIVKNKHAPPFRTAEFELEFGKGICRESEIIELGSKHKFITKAGALYSMSGQSFHGKDAIKCYIDENEDIREELMTKLRKKLFGVESGNGKGAQTEACEDDSEKLISTDTTDEIAACGRGMKALMIEGYLPDSCIARCLNGF